MAWQTNGIRRTLQFSIRKTEEEGHNFLNLTGQLVTSETRDFNFQNSFTANGVTYPTLDNTAFARLSEDDFNTRRTAAEWWILNTAGYGHDWNLSPEQWASLVQLSVIYLQVEAVINSPNLFKISSWEDSQYQTPLLVSQDINLEFTYCINTVANPRYEYIKNVTILKGESFGVVELEYPAFDGTTKYKIIPDVPGQIHLVRIFKVTLTPSNPEYDFSVNTDIRDIFEYGYYNCYN